MKTHHVLLVIAALVLGVLAKQFFWPAKQAEANGGPGLDITRLQNDNKNLPAQNMDDKTFAIGP